MKKRYLIAAGAGGFASAAVAAKLLSRPRDVEWREHAGRIAHAEYSWFAQVDGVRVHHQDAGPENGPAIILIHGFCASTLVWSEVFLPLASAGFRVIAVDLLGHGFSEKPKDGEYTIEAQARMVLRLMDQLGIERATLAGSSYGGAIAASIALDYPERVEKLVLVGSVINNEATKQPLLRLAGAPFVGNIISPLLLDSRWMVRRRLKKIFSEGAIQLFDEKRMDARHLPLKAASTHHAILQSLRRWKAERIERDAHLIKQPTLLIWGEQDNDTPLRLGKHLHDSMPDARLIIFRRCGHLPQEEYPQEFAELVKGFVNKEVMSKEVMNDEY
jgi:pimeloyl-ACP methyl ester carboxylesterase